MTRVRSLLARSRSARQTAASLFALLLVSLVVVRTSQAAFTAETRNEGNSFVVGHVDLVDGARGAIFNVRDLAPGRPVSRCITVTYAGTLTDAGVVRMYGTGYSDRPGEGGASTGLGSKLRTTVERGTGRAAPDGTCGPFTPAETIVSGLTLAELNRVHRDHGNGAGNWAPAPSESTTYRITVLLPRETGNDEQRAAVTDVSFTWEIRDPGAPTSSTTTSSTTTPGTTTTTRTRR